MFKNRELRVKMVKPGKDDTDPDAFVVRCNHDPVLTAVIIKDVVTHTALAVAGVIATKQGLIIVQTLGRELLYQRAQKMWKP